MARLNSTLCGLSQSLGRCQLLANGTQSRVALLTPLHLLWKLGSRALRVQRQTMRKIEMTSTRRCENKTMEWQRSKLACFVCLRFESLRPVQRTWSSNSIREQRTGLIRHTLGGNKRCRTASQNPTANEIGIPEAENCSDRNSRRSESWISAFKSPSAVVLVITRNLEHGV